MFKRTWWQQYETPLWVEREDGSRVVYDFDNMLQSWDMTFKDTKSADYVVGQVWMRRGATFYLLDQIRGRMDFVASCVAVRTMTARWPQALLKLIEDKANGPAVISALQHTVTGIVPEEPHGSKVSRAAAVSPIVEARQVWLPSPELAPWVGDFVEEHAGFPTAAHDDQVDGTSQALNRMMLHPFGTGDVTQPEEYDMVDARGWYASPV